ncbi:MAG: hypothetical protein EP330_01400 [Deltaproteobacteria bacterium]|nr:MAG: hypothetical protein EP330_01400 [Deltaproteobacteria bacterium]
MPLPLLPPPPLPHLVAPAPEPEVSAEAEAPADPGHAPAAFNPGTLEIKVRTAFNGAGYSPFSLIGAFLSWTEFQVAVDGGVFQRGDLAIGLGAEGFYGQPWFLQLLSRAVVGATTGETLRWRLIETGVAGRVTFHYAGLEVLDPYVVALAGPSLTRFRAKVTAGDTRAEGRFATAGLRMGAGGGIAGASANGFVAGAELRYLAGIRFQTTESVVLTDADGTSVDVFEWSSTQSPPAGFSWVFWAGYRF